MPEINENTLITLHMCTCVYHKVDWRFICFDTIAPAIKRLINRMLNDQPPAHLYELIERYLKRDLDPDPIFVEFLVSPYVNNDYLRKQFISSLWKELLRQKTESLPALGGEFCFIHGTLPDC